MPRTSYSNRRFKSPKSLITQEATRFVLFLQFPAPTAFVTLMPTCSRPRRVERMAKEMRASYVEHLRALQMREGGATAGTARELQGLEAASMPAMKAFTMLPWAAEAYRRQIALGLEGEPRAALKARSILREIFGGEIRLVPEPDVGLTAHWNLHTSVLVKTLGTCGSGGRMWAVPGIPQWARLK